MSPKIFQIALFTLFVEFSFCQESITLAVLANWVNLEEYPNSVFNDLEKNGYVFKELIKGDTALEGLSQFVYKSKKTGPDYGFFITVYYNEKTPNFNQINLQASKNAKFIFDKFIAEIKQNYKFLYQESYKNEEGINVTSYYYKYNDKVFVHFNSQLWIKEGFVIGDLFIYNRQLP